MKEYHPTHVGTVTKYVFIDSPLTTPGELVLKAYEISKGVMIKETCFGLQVTGSPDKVKAFTDQIRTVDPSHIFVKDRGFPPGDPRRCRANLGGARPGYHGHEYELSLIHHVAHGLDSSLEEGEILEPPVRKKKPLELSVVRHMIESAEH